MGGGGDAEEALREPGARTGEPPSTRLPSCNVHGQDHHQYGELVGRVSSLLVLVQVLVLGNSGQSGRHLLHRPILPPVPA